MRSLVTGGSGMIGSNLCRRLLADGHSVICVDNLSTGSKKNIADLLGNKKFKFLKRDASRKLPAMGRLDWIFHFASPASPLGKKSMHALAFETMEVNTEGTRLMCELALKNKARLMFASTSEVYGNPLITPQKETYNGNVSTTGPRSVYDEAKRFGETIVAAYSRSKGLDGRIVRIFNTYGPGLTIDDGRMLMEFVKAGMARKKITVFGDGSQTRSMCYVSDLVDGLVRYMEKATLKGEIINLGNPDERTILEIAEIVKKKLSSDSPIVFKPLPEDDPLRRQPDISKAKKLLKWQPKVTMDKGFELFIDYVRGLI